MMKKISRIIIVSFIAVINLFLLSSCDDKNSKEGLYSYMNSGTFTVYCDEAVYDMMKTPFVMYDSVYPNAKALIIKTNARDAMSKMLSGSCQAILISRGYLKDEDSLMKAYKVEPKERMIYAEDALVFFVKSNYPLDTIADFQLIDILTNKNASFTKFFPKLKNEPRFVISSNLSSEYANLNSLVIKKKKIEKKLIYLANSDSVRNYVLKNPDAIGIGYLSQVVKDTNLKSLLISFNDSTGKYVFPHVVHQANILRRYYPFIVSHYVYLLENRKNVTWWFATFIAKEAIIQKYFINVGIVPAYARISLIGEE